MSKEIITKQKIKSTNGVTRAYSGDQSLFSHWDSTVKLAGYRKHKGNNTKITHMFHLIDVLGRDNHPDQDQQQPRVSNEYYGHTNGKEVQPSWFAVSDVMPLPTLESHSPHKTSEFLNNKERFDVFANKLVSTLVSLDPLEADKVRQTLETQGYAPHLPNSVSDVYKQLTESNWYGIVDTSGKSASSYNFSEIERPQRKLMVKLYRHMAHAIPPEDRPEMRKRFEELVSGDNHLYQTIRDKSLPAVAEETYKLTTNEITRITGINFGNIDTAETTDYGQLPKRGENLRGDEDERFKFFNWYVKNRDLYDTAHNRVSEQLSKRRENPIQTISTTKGEAPFWIVENGQRTKLHYNDTSVSFGDKKISLGKPLENYQDIANALYTLLPDKKFSILPTAIGLLFQIRANGDVLLPEKGSSYTKQADMTWKEIAKNAKGSNLWDIMQNDTVRIHPHGLLAIPDGKRIRLPWYAEEGFTKDEEGYTKTENIKQEWGQVVANRRDRIQLARDAGSIQEKTKILFSGTSIPHVEELMRENEKVSQIENVNKEARSQLNSRIRELLSKQETPKVMSFVGQYLQGKIDSLPTAHTVFSQFAQELEALRNQEKLAQENKARQEQVTTMLHYYAALRYRALEGGAEALEYFDSRPSLLTLYIMFGDEAVRNVMNNAESHVDITDKEPLVKTERVNAEGNRLLVIEDKLGWASRDEDRGEEMIKKATKQLREDDLDTAILLTRPTKKEADYQMVIIEKDGSISNMCGNGVRAAAYFMKEHYGSNEVKLQTASGEIVTGFKGEGENEYNARLSPVAELSVESAQQFADIVSDSVRLEPNPMATLDNLAQQQNITTNIISIRHVLEEPHMIVRKPENVNDDDLREIGNKFMNLKDINGERVFPNGINVNFASGSLDNPTLLTYERGVNNLTGSCGTGVVCAASLAMENTGVNDITFAGREGSIRIQYHEGHYILSGKANQIV